MLDTQMPKEWRRGLWRLIGQTPELDWLLLTKCPQNFGRGAICYSAPRSKTRITTIFAGLGAQQARSLPGRSARDQCRQLDVALFMKQMTKKAPIPKDLAIRDNGPRTKGRGAVTPYATYATC